MMTNTGRVKLFAAIGTFFLFACCGNAQNNIPKNAPAKADLVDVAIGKPLPLHDSKQDFGFPNGTNLVFLVTVPSESVIGVNARGSKIVTFTDNTGKNLKATENDDDYSNDPTLGEGYHGISEGLASLRADETGVIVHASGRPNQKATRVHVQATFAIDYGRGLHHFLVHRIKLVPGARINAGGVILTLKSITSDPVSLQWEYKFVPKNPRDTAKLSIFEFKTIDDQEITQDWESDEDKSNDHIINSYTYEFGNKLPAYVNMEGSCYTQVSSTSVSVDTTAGIGL